MIFQKRPGDKFVTAILMVNQQPQYYDFEFHVCRNPLCRCGDLVIAFTQISGDTGEDIEPLVQFSVRLDVHAPQPAPPSTHTPYRYEDHFVAQLTPEDFRMLHSWHYLKKCDETEKAVFSTVEAEFDVEKVEKSKLVPYKDILHYSRHFEITLGDKLYHLIDSYCVRPGCPCTAVTFNFALIDTVKATGVAQTIYLVDYRQLQAPWKEKIAFRKEDFTPFDLQFVKIAVETSYPQFYQQLEQRHQRLKLLYAYYRKRNGLPSQQLILPIGRNENCPCGSGKKYKQCCLPALS